MVGLGWCEIGWVDMERQTGTDQPVGSASGISRLNCSMSILGSAGVGTDRDRPVQGPIAATDRSEIEVGRRRG